MRRTTNLPARILTIAGSDSGGGAGIQADLKTFQALGAFGMSAVTAITAQNTRGVSAVHAVPTDIVIQQIEAVLGDLEADAIKTGMMHDGALIAAVHEVLSQRATGLPLVVDPVMVAKGGARLLHPDATGALMRFCGLATVVTPNIPEAEVMAGHPIRSVTDMEAAARNVLSRTGARGVLIKGGHHAGPTIHDVYFDGSSFSHWSDERVMTRHTHGTGCTLASAIAAGLGQRMSVHAAIERARRYVRGALMQAPGFGQGHGPLWHGAGVIAFEESGSHGPQNLDC